MPVRSPFTCRIFLSACAVWFFLFCALPPPADCGSGAAGHADAPALWQPHALDQRRALPNDTSPPRRTTPLTNLPSLPPEHMGTIRRVTLPQGVKTAALTFDLCELDTQTTGCDMEILAFLHREKIPATLFMGGKWMRTHAVRTRQLMAEPLFEIGNHAWSHGNFALLSPEGMRAQIAWTQAQYELLREEVLHEARAAGHAPPHIPPVPTLFRLPYGRSSTAALKILAETGLQVVQWDVVAEGEGNNSSPLLAQTVAARVRPGSILLFHANLVPRHSTVLLQNIVSELRRKGYSFVTVSTLLQAGQAERTMDGYFSVPGDNKKLDNLFGVDGTGRKIPFTGAQ